MPKSILEAIKMGLWDFEPPPMGDGDFDGTDAMPGTNEKSGARGVWQFAQATGPLTR